MSYFMVPEMTGREYGLRVETTHGTWFLPGYVCGLPDDTEEGRKIVSDYVEGSVESVETIRGYFGRLSAPGYMDYTEWGFWTNKRTMQRDLNREMKA